MSRFMLIHLSLLFIFLISKAHATPTRHFGHCELQEGQNVFGVLPGMGWDNLRNVPMGRVFEKDFKSCLSSEDGFFLIPDNVNFESIKQSEVQLSSELFSTFNEYTSIDSKSINAEASGGFSFISVSGSYSEEFNEVKSQQASYKSVASRVIMRHNLYHVIQQPDQKLTTEFRNRLMDIASILSQKQISGDNNTRLMEYLSDLVVRDFGTHFVTSVNVGALLTKIDQLRSDYVESKKSQNSVIKAAAALSFSTFFKASANYETKSATNEISTYESNSLSSLIRTVGGPPAKANFSMTEWENDLRNNLVATDRRGEPIYNAITSRSLPGLPQTLVAALSQYIKNSIKLYYDSNSVSGCTDMRSDNYNFHANIDSGACEEPYNNLTFGGVYQTCSDGRICEAANQRNPATGDYSCGPDFFEVELFNIQVDCRIGYNTIVHWGFFSDDIEYVPFTYCGSLRTVWCAPNPNQKSYSQGYLMGGMYSSSNPNPVTGGETCPEKFFTVKFGIQHKLCLGYDTELMNDPKIPSFGGFYSCQVGNPMAENLDAKADEEERKRKLKMFKGNLLSNYPSRCGKGYSQMFGFIDSSCQVTLCAKMPYKVRHKFLAVKRPPFVTLQLMVVPKTERLQNLIPSDVEGTAWVANQSGVWSLKASLLSSGQKNKQERKMYIGGIIGIVCGAMALALIVVGLAVAVKKHSIPKWRRNTYVSIGDEDDNEEECLAHEVTNVEATTSQYGSHGRVIRVSENA